MVPQNFPSRGCVAIAGLFALLLSLSGCGNSSSVNVSAPSSLKRCGVSVTAPGSVVPSSGGTGTLAVSAERECGWSAHAESPWISLNTAEGQGPATLTYSVVANPNGSSRRGSVIVEQQRIEIVQEAAPCRFEVSPSTAELDAAGARAEITISGPGGCAWTAQSTAGWLTVQPGSGTGSAAIRLSAVPNTGAERSADVRVGGINVPVRQAGTTPPGPAGPGTPPAPGACAYDVAPARKTSAAAGETFTATVTTGASCRWTAASEASWIAVAGGTSGTGAGTVQLVVQANTGSARTGSVRIAGRPVTIEQEGGRSSCSYSISPTGRSIGREATDVTVEVRSSAGCGWSSSSHASWISVRDGATGSGNGEVRLSVAANTGSARSGIVTIAGTSFTIQQEGAPACTYSIKPDYYNAGRGRDEVIVGVSAPGGCAWSAASGVGWVTIAEGRSGSGAGNVRLVVDANGGAPRSTTLTIAGHDFRLSQEGVCETTIKPTYYNAGPGPDNLKIDVKVSGGCDWTATSPVAWAAITEVKGGPSGDVRLRLEANSGEARSTTLTIAGVPFALSQEAAKK
jgi:hypothetical protein